MTRPRVNIPHDWEAKPHQAALMRSFGWGKQYQRAAVVWHRRAGKDSTAINLTARETQLRTGTYWHLLPEQSQARRVIWNGIDRHGRRIIDQAFPPSIRKRVSIQEMLIELKGERGATGSIWQLAGSDNYDSLVGANPLGVVFSEWAIADPAAWEFIRPILAENGGWAMFIYTPRGMNHGFATYNHALTDPDWFAERLTIDDTGVISSEAVEAERRSGMGANQIAQEFHCSFEASNVDQFIDRALIEDAKRREVGPWARAMVWGLDVARYGNDDSALAKRRGNHMLEPVKWWNGNDLMETCGIVMREYEQTPPHSKPSRINVDVVGLGAGVVDRLREMGLPVTGVNVGERPLNFESGKYLRRGDELWGLALEWFNTREVSMCPDEVLEMELINRLYTIESGGKLRMEPKSAMKKRGLKSPDKADAFVLTFAGGDYAMGQRQEVSESGYDEFGGGDRRDRPGGRQGLAIVE